MLAIFVKLELVVESYQKSTEFRNYRAFKHLKANHPVNGERWRSVCVQSSEVGFVNLRQGKAIYGDKKLVEFNELKVEFTPNLCQAAPRVKSDFFTQ